MSKKIKYLILHCTATPEGRPVSKKELIKWFTDPVPLGNGWSKPGYRTMVHLDGQSSDLVDFDNDGWLEWPEVTYGAKGFNSESIHISYVGGVQKYNIKIPKDTRTAAQIKTLRAHTEAILSYHPDIQILGHNEVNPHKACPSFNVSRWLQSIDIPEFNIFNFNRLTSSARILLLSNPDTNMFDFDHKDI